MPEFRLQIVEEHNVTKTAQNSFVTRTAVDNWRGYIREFDNLQMPQPLVSNIAHRLQAMEFEAALILRHTESQGQTLMETILRFKIHYFAILANSILEGIGASIFKQNQNKIPRTNEWQHALAERTGLRGIEDKIADITVLRNRIHNDRIENQSEAHFNQIDYTSSFKPTHSTFRSVMNELNSNWPADCVLSEDIP